MFQAKLIVENVHLHLLPSMNPDGFSLRKRGNANNIDLNRDFPDQVYMFFNSNSNCNVYNMLMKLVEVHCCYEIKF